MDLLDSAKRQNVRLAHEVDYAAGSTDQDIASLLELFALETRRHTTVNDAGAKHGPIAESASIVKDLSRKLTRGTNDQDQRLGPHTMIARVEILGRYIGTRCSQLLGLAHQL